MKRWHLFIYFAIPIVLMGIVHSCWQGRFKQHPKPELVAVEEKKADVKELPKVNAAESARPNSGEDSKVSEIAKGFIENQTSLGLAALGGVAATLFAIIEKLRLTRWRQRCITVAISFFAGSLFFGYLATGTVLRQLSEVGTVLIDTGDFHVASSMQFIAIIAGAVSYAALILDLIHDPKRQPGSGQSE